MGKKIQCIGKYIMCGTTLGKGSYARVELATHDLTKCKVAVKIIETTKITEEYTRNNLYREARILSQLRHPNVIRFYESLRAGTLYCIVSEWAQGGDLLLHLKTFKDCRMPEKLFRPYFRQLLSALNYMHQRGIIHRDLKMENLLLDEKKANVKIIDFGLSNVLGKDKRLHTHCGSPEYAAPELFTDEKNYGAEVDIWSFGILSYTALVGVMPFSSPYYDHQRNRRLLVQIKQGLQDRQKNGMLHLTPECQSILQQMIEPNPKTRLTLDKIQIHCWVTKNGKLPFSNYIPPPRDFAIRSQFFQIFYQVIEELASLVGMPRVDVERSVAEFRSNELSAMFSMLLEAQKNIQGIYNRDHTFRKDIEAERTLQQSNERDKWRVLRSKFKQSAKVFQDILQERAAAATQKNGAMKLNAMKSKPSHQTHLMSIGAAAADFCLEDIINESFKNDDEEEVDKEERVALLSVDEREAIYEEEIREEKICEEETREEEEVV